ncbi:MAG: hypothetical protein ACHQEB_03830 [Chitinophagales bacterium]
MPRILACCFIFCSPLLFAQGKYAGPVLKKLIGKTFTNERHIPGLNGYQFREGSMITDINDPEPQALDVLLKGTKAVVVFSAMSDIAKKIFQIVDIIEIQSIQAGWEIKTAGCQAGQAEGEIIVALVKPGNKEYTTSVKQAYRCNRDKIRFEMIGVKNIRCLNEGFGQE